MKRTKPSKAERRTKVQTFPAKSSARSNPYAPFLRPAVTAPCRPERLAPYNSYGVPRFVERGYYADIPFLCRDCGKAEIWTAAQQQWWYEVAKGHVESCAIRCRACRQNEQKRKKNARRRHLEGLAARHSPERSGRIEGSSA
jgi:hypothetical protein